MARSGPRVVVEDRILKVAVPPGSRVKGHETYTVQELVLTVHAVRYRRERWLTPDGKTIIAPQPAGTKGYFGPNPRRSVLKPYHPGQSTLPRLAALLPPVGMAIAKPEIQRRLTEGQKSFLTENRDVLRAGHTNFVLNAAAFDSRRSRALPATLIARLAEEPETIFADQTAWSAHRDRLGFTGLTTTTEPADRFAGHRFASRPDPVRIATAGAIRGSVHAHDFRRDAVVLSDDAGQFAVGRHTLCWVHVERLVHRLDTFTDLHRAAQQKVRQLTWDFYADLKLYQANPGKRRRPALRARFDRIVRRRTGFVTLDRLLARLHADKAALLMVLDRPETPLNTNGSANDIRCHVTRRKVSACTRSDPGRDGRDAFAGLDKTSARHAIAFWDDLGDRLNVPGHVLIPPLPEPRPLPRSAGLK